jgi:hypothetical protein
VQLTPKASTAPNRTAADRRRVTTDIQYSRLR